MPRPMLLLLVLLLVFLLPAWGDAPDSPPLGACYMGYGKALEAAQPRQLSLNAHVTRFLYQPGGLEMAYEGSRKEGDDLTQFIRLVGVRRGETTTLISTTTHVGANGDQAEQDDAPYSLSGWSGDGRYLLINQERLVKTSASDGDHSRVNYLCVDVGADPIHLSPIPLPDAEQSNPNITALWTTIRFWWSPDRTRVLFATLGEVKQGGSYTFQDISCQVYDPKTDKIQDVTLGEKQVVRGWIDSGHLLLDDSPLTREATPTSKVHYASYDVAAGTQKDIPTPAKMPALFDDVGYPPTMDVSPKAAYLRLEDESHRIQDQQKVGTVDAYALWVRRTQGPKLMSAAPVGLTPGKEDPQAMWSPTGAQIAFIAHGDLFVTDLTTRDATVAEKYAAGEKLTCPEERDLATSNLKDVGLAILQYTQDFDEKFPPADQWQDRIKPYLEPETLLSIGGHPVVYHAPANLAFASIDAPADTILGTIDLPCATVTLYADGHVKALPKQAE